MRYTRLLDETLFQLTLQSALLQQLDHNAHFLPMLAQQTALLRIASAIATVPEAVEAFPAAANVTVPAAAVTRHRGRLTNTVLRVLSFSVHKLSSCVVITTPTTRPPSADYRAAHIWHIACSLLYGWPFWRVRHAARSKTQAKCGIADGYRVFTHKRNAVLQMVTACSQTHKRNSVLQKAVAILAQAVL